MSIKLNAKTITGLAAAALSATLIVAAPAQAETRTFSYGTYGSAKYDGASTSHVRKPTSRAFTTNRSALRFGRSDRRQNFSSGNSYKSRIKISR